MLTSAQTPFTLVDPADPRPIHFIGIAGAGMSALAELLVRRGVRVTGTDANASGAPDLVALGITVSPPDVLPVRAARAVVFSSAIAATHPEMAMARSLGLPLIRRAEALAEAVRGGTLIGISGTHGKTTTTVMTTEALAAAGVNPTGVVGGRVGHWGGNLRLGGSVYVVEADEYDRSFLALAPDVAVVLNVEEDHLDIYRDLADILRAFAQFVSGARVLVRCADDAGAMALQPRAGQDVIDYSANPAQQVRLVARALVLDTAGAQFDVEFDGAYLGHVALGVPGVHNVRNALAAIGAGLAVGCSLSDMSDGLRAFRGVERRFQRLGCVAGVDIVDDYAHHPTEVAATIAAARYAFPSRRVIVVFQPHLYSRTRDLQEAFAVALSAADQLLLCDIYGAREVAIPSVTSALIGDRVRRDVLGWTGPRAMVVDVLRANVRPGDVVITMGAGDVTTTGPELLRALQTGSA